MLPERVLLNFRLSTDAIAMLTELKAAKGIAKTAVVETAIRDYYKRSSSDLARMRQSRKLAVASKES
jgi:hypothetical protein